MQTLTQTKTIQAVQFDGTAESARKIEEIVASKGWSHNPYGGVKSFTYDPPVITWRRMRTENFTQRFLNEVFPSRIRNSETHYEYLARKRKALKEYGAWYDSKLSVEIVTLTGLVKVWNGQWLVVDNDKIEVLDSVDGFNPVKLDTTE